MRFNRLAEAADVLVGRARRRDRRDRRAARHRRSSMRARTSSSRAGTSSLAMSGPAQRGSAVRRQRRASRPAGGGAAGRGGRQARDRHARALLRARDRRPQPRRLRPLLPGARRADHDQQPAARGAPRGQPAGRRDRQRLCRPSSQQRLVDQVVVEHGTLPLDELYFALKEQSTNRGEVDYRALIAGRPQAVVSNPEGPLPAVPDRRCGREPQHPRRDLRRAAPVQGSVGPALRRIRRKGAGCSGELKLSSIRRWTPVFRDQARTGRRCVVHVFWFWWPHWSAWPTMAPAWRNSGGSCGPSWRRSLSWSRPR